MELEFYHILHCLNPNLVASIIISPTGLFSVNCSETAFCILHFSISNLTQSSDFGQNSDGVFPISELLVNPLKEIVIAPEPVILSWNLAQ